MATPPLDPALAREAYDAWKQHGQKAKAAKALGLKRSTFDNRWNKARELGMHLSDGARRSMQAASLSGIEAKGGWKHIHDDDGNKIETVRWSAPKDQEDEQAILERVRAAFDDLTAAPVLPNPEYADTDLLTMYPLADVHMGLQAWGRETGEDYDTDQAAERVTSWVAQCVAASPASETAVILSAGDLTHADDQTNMTRKSGHILDVDTRHFKTIDVTISALVAAIDCAAQKHQKVIVRIIPGNHDPFAYMGVLFALAERYRDNPRIRVQKQPGEWFVRQHGKVMLAAHHGDKAKAERMVHFIADQYAELWGKTKWRYLFTGHLHSNLSQDIGGVRHERLRAITARDAYAVSNAYVSRAQLQAITFHRNLGEVSRVMVNGS